MDGLALLERAHDAGLEVTADGDELKICGPKAAESLALELLAHKSEVLPLVQTQQYDMTVELRDWSDFKTRERLRVVNSYWNGNGPVTVVVVNE